MTDDKIIDPDIERYYDKPFFDLQACHQKDYDRMAEWLLKNLAFETVIDIGCGNGLMLLPLLRVGKTVWGVDASLSALSTADPLVLPYIGMADLRQPVELPPSDLAICIEVGEHLEKEHADTLIQSVVTAAKTWVFFSAATPGQGGMAHFNEQPHEYWIEKFKAQGFDLKKDETASMREYLKGIAACWFTNNALIFKRAE